MRELIHQRRFTIEEVAEAVGVSSRTMRRWTTTAPIDKLYAISKVIGVPIYEIIDYFDPDRDIPTQIELEDN